MPMTEDFMRRLFPNIPAIAAKFGTPFQLDDGPGIRQKLKNFNGAFRSRGIDFKNFFAVKANPLQAITDIVMEEGGGFDCSSVPEVRMARRSGARPEDIMFTSNNTSQEEYLEANGHGGCILNFDDKTGIAKVPGTFPRFVSFRLNPGKLKAGDEVNSIIGDPTDSKYGVPITEAIPCYRDAYSRGARDFGVHGMFVSNELNVAAHLSTAGILLNFAGVLIRSTGIKPKFINAGGGIGTQYRPDQPEFDLEAYASGIGELLAGFTQIHRYTPRFFLECGRYVTGPHGVFVSRVINLYSKGDKNYAGIETAMPALMRPAMYGSYHHITVLDKNGVPKSGPTKKYAVVGPICENCDRITPVGQDRELPIIEEGDFIVVHNTGAHGIAMGFNYNMRVRPQTLLWVSAGEVRRTSRAETYDDLIVRQQGLGAAEDILELG
jgi:diaminopimelate decarboxylase